jgi:hypothetical protein
VEYNRYAPGRQAAASYERYPETPDDRFEACASRPLSARPQSPDDSFTFWLVRLVDGMISRRAEWRLFTARVRGYNGKMTPKDRAVREGRHLMDGLPTFP